MALALKITLGATAASVILIAASERSRPVAPVVAREPIETGIEFAERFPILIGPPSDEWRAKAMVPVPPQPEDQAELPRGKAESQTIKPSRKKVRHRITCRRVYYTVNRHRYWKCRR